MLSFQSALIFLVVTATLTIFVIAVLIRGAIRSFVQRLRYQQLAKELGCRYGGALTFYGKQSDVSWRTDAFSDEHSAQSHYTVFTATLSLPKATRFAIMAPEMLSKFEQDNRSVMAKVQQVWQHLAGSDLHHPATQPPSQAGQSSRRFFLGSNRFNELLWMTSDDPRWAQLVTPTLEQLWLDWPGMDPRRITCTAMHDRLELTVMDQILSGSDQWRQFIQLGLHLTEQSALILATPSPTAQAL